MTARTNALPPRLESAVAPQIEWLAERSDERQLLIWAAVIAVLLHGLAFMIDLPEAKSLAPPPVQSPVPVVYTYPLPPPPPPRAAAIVPIDTTRRLPIPDREPDSPEPVTEPVPEVFEPAPVYDGIDLPIAVPVAPPAGATGPIPIGPDIQQPVLIEPSKVSPEYPEVPRRAGLSGDVIVQAVIHRDGSVGEVTVLRSLPPGLGFEEAAVEAVRQWRYEPALQFGKPVEVYFTVYVNFDLR